MTSRPIVGRADFRRRILQASGDADAVDDHPVTDGETSLRVTTCRATETLTQDAVGRGMCDSHAHWRSLQVTQKPAPTRNDAR